MIVQHRQALVGVVSAEFKESPRGEYNELLVVMKLNWVSTHCTLDME